jgi:hypothetical protein
MADFCNFYLNFVTYKNVIKWDCDCIANKSNLIAMIDKYNLRNNNDAICINFSGETIFLTDTKCFINRKSYYDEYRAFSKKNGFAFMDYDTCEGVETQYLNNAKKYIFDLPCFYEVKTTYKDEFLSRNSFIDSRDEKDFEIISALKNNIIPNNLEPFDYAILKYVS